MKANLADTESHANEKRSIGLEKVGSLRYGHPILNRIIMIAVSLWL